MPGKKALMLLSGGLDSTIVLGLLKQQGVEVEAVHFTSLFCTCGGKGGGCGPDTEGRHRRIPRRPRGLL